MGSNGRKQTWTKSALYMDTVVALKIVTSRSATEVETSIKRAFEAFRLVEQVCSRFHEQSELRRLTRQIGTPVPVSDLLFETIRFAWNVADLTNGAFDPTIGHTLETYGFNRHYLTGQQIQTDLVHPEPVTYQDIVLDEENRTILLHKPLVIDLGAVAKGFAVDLAVKELRHFEGFVVDAGGDLFAGGLNELEEPWHVGIRHPLQQEETICSLRLTEVAICTSGSYERTSPIKSNTHHIIDPQSGESRPNLLSCSVIAPFAMLADAFSTAAFLFGPEKGTTLLNEVGLQGLWIPSNLELHMTNEMKRYLYEHK